VIKPHQFIGLAGATVVSLLLAVGLYSGASRWSTGVIEGSAFLPDLPRDLPKVTAVEVTQGGRKLTLERAGEAWRVRDRGGYPAKTEAVRQLLVQLAEARLIEPRTSVKTRHALLELEEPSAADAKSRGVRLLDQSGKPVASVVLGKARFEAFGSGRSGLYVRRAGEDQSWLATGDPKVTADLRDWVDTKLLALEAAKVAKVVLEHPGEEPLVVERTPAEAKADTAKPANATPIPPPAAAKDGKFRVAKVPDGMKLKKDAGVDQIVDGFASIDFEDVRKLDAAPSGDKVSIVKVEQEGGPALTLRLRRDGDAAWLSLEAAGADGDAKKKADEINAKAKGWEYKIPTWKADQIGKRRADLFETS
jgi:hypothetical protein